MSIHDYFGGGGSFVAKRQQEEREAADRELRERQRQEHEIRQRREQEIKQTTRKRLHSVVEKRAQAWDWITLSDGDDNACTVHIAHVGRDRISIVIRTEAEIQVQLVDNGPAMHKTDLIREPGDPGFTVLLEQDTDLLTWDWIQLLFPDQEQPVDVIISRAWFRKVALAIQALPEILIRKTEAPG